MKAGLIGFAAVFVSAVLLAAAPGHAQSPPPAPLPAPGFMPPYEVTKMIRSAGFEPLAPPLREGTTYVLRATDFRGILMRVVVDARSGAIRAVNRIVPGPAPYGQVGMVAAPYGMPPAYGIPPDADGSELAPEEAALGPPPSPTSYSGLHSYGASPPLPRPRPAELAARDAKASPKPAISPAAQAVEVPAVKPEPKPSTTASTPSPSPAPMAPKRPAPSAIPD
ncbi:MAG TPA: hypothetical protein VMV19_10890 [Xanthobacteraceae bacterium]|nr:hypothetical protein [Xanthobacteraceae bacterium]